MSNIKIENLQIKRITEVSGGDGRSELYTTTDLNEDKTQIVIQETVIRRFPAKDYKRVMELYNTLEVFGLGTEERMRKLFKGSKDERNS